MTIASAALPVTVSTEPPTAGPVTPVAVVTGGPVQAGPAQAVYVVTAAQLASGAFRLNAGPAQPVVAVSGRPVVGGRPIPVYAVSGSFGSAAPPFTPSDLAGLAMWLDASALTLNNNDPISTFTDRSGSGNSPTAASTARPTFLTAQQNGLAAASFDGSNDAMTLASLTLSGAQTIVWCGKPGANAVGGKIAYEHGANANSNPGTYLVLQSTTTGGVAVYRAAGARSIAAITNPTASTAHIVTQLLDGNCGNHRVYVDGALSQLTPSQLTNPATTNATAAFYLGGRTAASLFYGGLLFECIVINRMLTDTERRQLENYLATKWAISYTTTYSFLNSDLVDNVYSTPALGYLQSSALARMQFVTDATGITVEAYTDYYTAFPALSSIGVRVNGADNSTQSFSANNQLQYFTPTIAAGAGKTIEVISGAQSVPASTKIGSFIRAVHIVGTATPATNAPPRLVVYGDSIIVGANATSPALDAWTEKVRQSWPGGVTLEAWGSRNLYDDANTGGLRAALVTQLAQQSPTAIWLAIGTNDYGLNKWAAAAFGTAYAALLDDLHTALPSATIYCQTPISRVAPAVETANGSGSTLSNYRTQIATAQSTRSSYAVLVDGTAINLTGLYAADGIHPTTAGHAAYATAARAALGI